MIVIGKPKFPIGQLVATPGALAAMAEASQNAMHFISRHITGDWGDCCRGRQAGKRGRTSSRRTTVERLSHVQEREAVGHHRGRPVLDLRLAS